MKRKILAMKKRKRRERQRVLKRVPLTEGEVLAQLIRSLEEHVFSKRGAYTSEIER